MAHIDEFDRDEWREVARIVKPEMTDEEFDASWESFQQEKRRRGM